MTIDMMEPLQSRLAEARQVIAIEQQGHGRTVDVDRPLTYEQMADATAAASPCSSRSAIARSCGSSS